MLQIEKQLRDDIVKALLGQVVPTTTGATLHQIAQLLSKLEEIKEEKPKEKKESK